MKKISVILAVLMLVSALSLSAFAAGSAVFTVGSAAGKPGDTVTVPVVLKNSPGIVGAQLDLKFDANVLSVASYTTKDSRFVYAPYNAEALAGASKVTLVMANISLNKIDGDIAIADVSFKIADNAADGTYEIAVENASAYTSDPNATDAAKQFPYVDTTAGKAVIVVSKDGTATVPKFLASRTYGGQFTDVTEDKWFHSFVKTAYEYALANGTSATTFTPDGKFTVAQALTAAVNIHTVYTGKTVDTTGAKNWYDPYVAYCVENGIIKEGQFTDFNKNISRGDMAIVFANILPAEEYAAIREKNLPDVTDDMTCAAAVRLLANAGIVGGDDKGNYNAANEITRAEACVIFTRIAVASMRDAK